MSDMLQLVVAQPTEITSFQSISSLGLGWLRHEKLKRLLQKGPPVLGAQASSPARVPTNQQQLTELIALDGQASSPALPGPCGLFQETLKHIGHELPDSINMTFPDNNDFALQLFGDCSDSRLIGNQRTILL